jgi:hypothetical protein
VSRVKETGGEKPPTNLRLLPYKAAGGQTMVRIAERRNNSLDLTRRMP